MGLTITEKILNRVAGKKVSAGEYAVVKPDLALSYSGVSYFPPLMEKRFRATPGLEDVGAQKVCDPNKIVVINDHSDIPGNAAEAESLQLVREAVKKQGVTAFYEGEGIGHQVAIEKGHAKPGMMIVHFDSHVTTCGAVGAYATGVHLDDLLQVVVTDETWIQVPESIAVEISGRLPPRVMARDIWHHILADIGPDGGMGSVLEFRGPIVDAMSVDGRMTMCNLVWFSGAETGVINPDKRTLDYLKPRVRGSVEAVRSDPDAEYSKTLTYDVSNLEPQIAVPPDVFYIKPVSEVEGVEVDQCSIATCASARLEDLQAAAEILRNHRVKKGVRMIVTPASNEVYLRALKSGIVETLVKAGAQVTRSCCDSCYGRIGYLSAGETCISTAPLNIPGRMGNTDAKIYLGSAAVVAASSVKGKITDPRHLDGR